MLLLLIRSILVSGSNTRVPGARAAGGSRRAHLGEGAVAVVFRGAPAKEAEGGGERVAARRGGPRRWRWRWTRRRWGRAVLRGRSCGGSGGAAAVEVRVAHAEG